jgi:hypothetical protein
MTVASVIVPVHDHAATLATSVRSALAQNVRDLEVIIVGDGVTPAVRAVAQDLVAEDPRVRFLDFPKGPHHGEVHRHTAIQQSTGDTVFYLCDDDLLLPEHVSDLLDALRDHDIAQSLNGYIRSDETIGLYPGDLGDPWYVARLCDLSHEFNFVSLTGTAHTRSFYEGAGAPWETTPVGAWPDRHQWRRMIMGAPGCRGTTTSRMTALAFPTHHGRDSWTPEERADEIETWMRGVVTAPDAALIVGEKVREAAVRQLVDTEKARWSQSDLRSDAERRIDTITSSRWWKLGRRLRPALRGREI